MVVFIIGLIVKMMFWVDLCITTGVECDAFKEKYGRSGTETRNI